jgi:2-polyprenyl-3-methyl-5-hydroxy-6-metoxy-1,4-benzoquinol methylase
MTNAYGKEVDTTYLDPYTAAYRQVLHRDMAAHNFRWSYVAKFLREGHRHKTWHVLDAGCGRLVNLAKLLYHNMLVHTTGSYTGVDYGPVPRPETIKEGTTKFNMRLYEKTDFADFDPNDQPKNGWDLITSFEVLEHVEPLHSYSILRNMRRLVRDEGYAIISTPNYSAKVGAAKNHVNEMTFQALAGIIHAAGWSIEKVYGTFASQTDYKKELSAVDKDFMDRLAEYYDSTAISLIMAPLIPAEKARNCMWVLRPGSPDTALLESKQLDDAVHSNSNKWQAHRKHIIKQARKTK